MLSFFFCISWGNEAKNKKNKIKKINKEHTMNTQAPLPEISLKKLINMA